MSKLKGIKLIAPIFDLSGYAEWSRNYALALHKCKVPLTIFPVKMDKTSPELGQDGEVLKSLVSKDIDYNVVISWNVPPVTEKLFSQEKKDVLKIAFTLWETDKLPNDWPELINRSVDECWLPGSFNEGVFKNSGVKVPIRTIPYPLDFSKYSSSSSINLIRADQSRMSDDTYVFYFISQWSERKNFADLLQAYWSEFSEEEKVCLVLKTHLTGNLEDAQKLTNIISQLKSLGNYKNDPEVVLIAQSLPRDKMFGLHKRADCYVSPSRGEGLGLGILEAGIFGNPIISNLFGEQASYVNEENSYIYNHSLRPVINMPWSTWYSADQYWAQPDIRGLAKKMRYSFDNKDESVKLGQKFSDSLKEKCNIDKVCESIISSLEDSLK